MELRPLPLFPLNTVLFPGGELSLRIFETRYLDLVSDCGHQGAGFGICRILEGEEVGVPAIPAAIGCEARVVDFSSGADGLLVLSVRGERRFRVDATTARDNGLIVAQVEWLAEPTVQQIAAEHELLALLLRRIVESAGPPHDRVDKARFEDANWVSWRLAEWLPLSGAHRQSLLEQVDAHARLQRLIELIPDFQSF